MMRVCGGVPGDAFCGKLIPEGSRASGYKCRDCANEIQRRKRARRGSTTQRGLGADHQKLAKRSCARRRPAGFAIGLLGLTIRSRSTTSSPDPKAEQRRARTSVRLIALATEVVAVVGGRWTA